MNSIHDAIEARWAETAALVALVPLRNLGVGKFPAERADAITYPYVSREIQSEAPLYYSSDGMALRAFVMFRIWSPRHEDGKAIRNAFRGERGDPDGFENQTFEAGERLVLLSRESEWGEFQEPDGMWSFMMLVRMDHKDPLIPPVPDPDDEEEEPLMFSQTETVQAAGTVVESALLGAGVGDVTIVANDWAAGEEWIAELSGDWTMTGSDASVTLKITIGGVTIAEIDVNLMFGGEVIPWYWRVRVTRLTTGVAGTVKVEGDFASAGTNAEPRRFRDAAAITLPSNADADPVVTVQWSAAHADNRFRMMAPSSFRMRSVPV